MEVRNSFILFSRDVAQRLEGSFRKLTWARDCPSLMKRFLTKKVFERLKRRVSPARGNSNLYDVIVAGVENLETEIGAFASDTDDYRIFWPLFKPIISSHHGFMVSSWIPFFFMLML